MWEFSINLTCDNLTSGKYIYHKLKEFALQFGSVVTSYECDGFMTIVVGCEEFDKVRMQYAINDILVYVICNFFKEKFLEKYINVPLKNKINMVALKKALVSFDKETDVHIIQKYLTIEKNIYLESFFDFKLIALKNKWLELVKLANDNSSFLICDDTYCELLKFLIDNLEVCFDQINIVEVGEDYKLCDNSFCTLEKGEQTIGDDKLVEKLISLCPRVINIYCDEYEGVERPAIKLISRIFDSRVKVMPKELAHT